jgi:N6-adenosine-specific RNA methylase IME4
MLTQINSNTRTSCRKLHSYAAGNGTNSGKSPKYPLLNLREIAALGDVVADLAGRGAVLYLWATIPHLPEAIDTLAAWGFRYRSLHVWKKTRVACRFWALPRSC